MTTGCLPVTFEQLALSFDCLPEHYCKAVMQRKLFDLIDHCPWISIQCGWWGGEIIQSAIGLWINTAIVGIEIPDVITLFTVWALGGFVFINLWPIGVTSFVLN
jgi:hypothetical protein